MLTYAKRSFTPTIISSQPHRFVALFWVFSSIPTASCRMEMVSDILFIAQINQRSFHHDKLPCSPSERNFEKLRSTLFNICVFRHRRLHHVDMFGLPDNSALGREFKNQITSNGAYVWYED